MRASPTLTVLILSVLAVFGRVETETMEAMLPPEAPASAPTRLELDYDALQTYRPGYPFWKHVFAIPDGSVAFGSARDGRLLAVFPARGDWTRLGVWAEPTLTGLLESERFEGSPAQRREQVARLLEPTVGAILHNETRGEFLRPNVERYGGFLDAWGRIYERFGVPADIGLAQALVESGLNGRVRSEARALGFCQWLEGNWNRLKRLSPHPIEGFNQTTQAPYCAAYLTVLATKYGSYIPALSEHHAGGTNVGRTLTFGEWLGGRDGRERYLLGSQFIRDIREAAPQQFSDLVGTYGPRSFRYAEMVFGNAATVERIRDEVAQEPLHAVRVAHALTLDELRVRTGLSSADLQRFNPALVRQVPAEANLYLPFSAPDLGTDVSFWNRPPNLAFTSPMERLLAIDVSPEAWDDPSFAGTLESLRRSFAESGTEEGDVMATILAYYMEEAFGGVRAAILGEVRAGSRVREMFERAVEVRTARVGA